MNLIKLIIPEPKPIFFRIRPLDVIIEKINPKQ